MSQNRLLVTNGGPAIGSSSENSPNYARTTSPSNTSEGNGSLGSEDNEVMSVNLHCKTTKVDSLEKNAIKQTCVFCSEGLVNSYAYAVKMACHHLCCTSCYQIAYHKDRKFIECKCGAKSKPLRDGAASVLFRELIEEAGQFCHACSKQKIIEALCDKCGLCCDACKVAHMNMASFMSHVVTPYPKVQPAVMCPEPQMIPQLTRTVDSMIETNRTYKNDLSRRLLDLIQCQETTRMSGEMTRKEIERSFDQVAQALMKNRDDLISRVEREFANIEAENTDTQKTLEMVVDELSLADAFLHQIRVNGRFMNTSRLERGFQLFMGHHLDLPVKRELNLRFQPNTITSTNLIGTLGSGSYNHPQPIARPQQQQQQQPQQQQHRQEALVSPYNIFEAPGNAMSELRLNDLNQQGPWNNANSWADALNSNLQMALPQLNARPMDDESMSLMTRVTNLSINPPPHTSQIRRDKMIYHQKFGEFGVLDGQFTEPSGVAVSLTGDIIVADTNNHRIQIFDSEGRFRMAFGECGKRDGQLLYPNRVAIIPGDGDVVVTERSPTHQVQIFNIYGQFVRKFGSGVLQHPRGVCVDENKNIIVIECKVMRVIIFNVYGQVKRKFSCANHLEFPNGVCSSGDEIFISDNRAHCVKVFDYEGNFKRTIGGEGKTNYPIGVGIDRDNNIVIADNHNNFNLTVFTIDGQYIRALESKVKHAQCFDVALLPDGTIALASKDYRVYLYRYGNQPERPLAIDRERGERPRSNAHSLSAPPHHQLSMTHSMSGVQYPWPSMNYNYQENHYTS